MCVIIHIPANEKLTHRDAIALWKTNPDGGGIAYPYKGRIVTRKTMKFAEWWNWYKEIRAKHPNVSILGHFRIATHGTVDITNVHPFQVDENTVMAHNGIIHDCAPERFDTRSDTRVFVEDVLPRLPKQWLDDDYLPMMVDSFIGYSKLMFLTVDPDLRHTVYRFGKWIHHEGLWLSNDYGLPNGKVKFPKFKGTGSKAKTDQASEDFWASVEDDDYLADLYWWEKYDRAGSSSDDDSKSLHSLTDAELSKLLGDSL